MVRRKNDQIKGLQNRITSLEIEVVRARGELQNSQTDLSQDDNTDKNKPSKAKSGMNKLLGVLKMGTG